LSGRVIKKKAEKQKEKMSQTDGKDVPKKVSRLSTGSVYKLKTVRPKGPKLLHAKRGKALRGGVGDIGGKPHGPHRSPQNLPVGSASWLEKEVGEEEKNKGRRPQERGKKISKKNKTPNFTASDQRTTNQW